MHQKNVVRQSVKQKSGKKKKKIIIKSDLRKINKTDRFFEFRIEFANTQTGK